MSERAMDTLQTEIKDIVAVGYLNGLFILARSIGLIGNSLYPSLKP